MIHYNSVKHIAYMHMRAYNIPLPYIARAFRIAHTVAVNLFDCRDAWERSIDTYCLFACIPSCFRTN